MVAHDWPLRSPKVASGAGEGTRPEGVRTNPRPSAWEADALLTGLLPDLVLTVPSHPRCYCARPLAYSSQGVPLATNQLRRGPCLSVANRGNFPCPRLARFQPQASSLQRPEHAAVAVPARAPPEATSTPCAAACARDSSGPLSSPSSPSRRPGASSSTSAAWSSASSPNSRWPSAATPGSPAVALRAAEGAPSRERSINAIQPK